MLVAISEWLKSTVSMEGVAIDGRGSRWWLCEAFMCHCGFSVTARPSQGSVGRGHAAQRGRKGEASHYRRRRCETVGKVWDGGERQSREGASPFTELESGGKPVYAPCPIRRAPNQGEHQDADYY